MRRAQRLLYLKIRFSPRDMGDGTLEDDEIVL